MPSKIISYGNSVRGNSFQVIMSVDSPGGTEALEVPLQSLGYNYEANEQASDAALVPSTCTATILIQNQAQRNKLNELLNGSEDTNYLTVMRNNAVDWRGGIMVELKTEEDRGFPQSYTIRATDGVAKLKDTPYDFSGIGDDEYEIITEQIRRVLLLCPNASLYAANEPFVRFNVTTWPDQLTSSNAVNSLDRLRVSTKAFRTVDRAGEVTFLSAYKVIVEQLKGFGLRMVYAKGVFNIFTPVSATAYDEGMVWHVYDKELTKISTVTNADWSSDISVISTNVVPGTVKMLAGGKITSKPPIRQVNYYYKHYSKQNLSPQANWTHLQNDPVSIQNYQSGGGAAVRITGRISPSVTPPDLIFPSVPVHVIVNMSLFVDDGDGNQWTLKRDYNYAAGQINYNENAWFNEAPTPGSCPVAALVTYNGGYITSFSITTPPVPISGSLSLAFILRSILRAGVNYAFATAEYNISDVFIESLIEGSNEDQFNYSWFRVLNSNFQANSRIERRETLIGDGPELNTFGRIQASNTPDQGGWVNTSNWRHMFGGVSLSGSSVSHTLLLARGLLEMRKDQRDQLDGSFLTTDYYASKPIRRSNNVYLPLRARFDLINDDVRGTWLQIGYNPLDEAEPDGTTTEFIAPPPNTDDTVNVDGPISDAPMSDLPIGVPQVAINTVITTIDTLIPAGIPVNVLDILATPDDIPLQAGQQLIITHPYTGQTQLVTVTTDYVDGVPNPWITPGGDTWTTPGGSSWIVDSSPGLAVASFTPDFDIPVGSYVQVTGQGEIQAIDALREAYEVFTPYEYFTAVTTGVPGMYWRPVQRVGWLLTGVCISLGSNASASTISVDIKHDNGNGSVTTVATYEGTALTFFGPLSTPVISGHYFCDVTAVGANIQGMQIAFQMKKTIT